MLHEVVGFIGKAIVLKNNLRSQKRVWKHNSVSIYSALRRDIFIMRREKVTAKNPFYIMMHIFYMDMRDLTNSFPELIYYLKKFVEILGYFLNRSFAILSCHSCIMRRHPFLNHNLKEMTKIVFYEFEIHILYFTQRSFFFKLFTIMHGGNCESHGSHKTIYGI